MGDHTYDFAIIGSGSAGAIIAARLTENPNISVVLIESGPMYREFTDMPDFIKGFEHKYDSSGDPIKVNSWTDIAKSGAGRMFVARSTDHQQPMLVPRGTTLGGSSSVNAQIFLRGEPQDYDSWASFGNDQWSYKDCLPFFRKLETDLDFSGDFHGTTGPVRCKRDPEEEWQDNQMAFYKSCQTLGFRPTKDHNDPDSTGVGPVPFNTIDGVRQSTWLTYLKPVMKRENLTIIPEALVISLNFNGTKAESVTISHKRQTSTIEAGEVIVSGGAIGSPQLLMVSGIGDAEQLETHGIKIIKDLPGVGKNLRDHPQAQVVWKTKENHSQDPDPYKRVQVGLRYTASNSDLRNDMFLQPVSTANPSVYLGPEDSINHIAITAMLYLAKGRGSITLRSADPLIQPYLDYNFLQEEEDLRRLREGVELCISVVESPEYKDIVEERVFPRDKDMSSTKKFNNWLLKNVRTTHHVSGTCKMGPDSDSMAVVNQFGKVHGIENLRVADASIMPDCVRANTNVATMMIGERIADFICNNL